MKILKSIAIIGLIGLSSMLGYSQEDPAWQRTLATHFPISYSDSDWWLVATTVTNIDFFITTKDVDIHQRTFSTWVRMYDYKEKTVTFLKNIYDRNEKKEKTLYVVVYNMQNGTLLSQANQNHGWQYAVPDSMGEEFYSFFNKFENGDRNKSPLTFRYTN